MYRDAYSNQYPNNESSIEARLNDCKAGLESLVAALQPYEPLDDIDVPRLGSMISLLQGYILLFEPVVNRTSFESMDESEIAFLEQSCRSASTVHKSFVRAIGQLRTARKASVTIENSIRNTGGFNVDMQIDYFACLDNCLQALTIALENILI